MSKVNPGIFLDNVSLQYPPPNMGLKHKLLLRDSFNFQQQPSLSGISLHVGPGQSLGLVGLNGGGKTTLLRVLAGILPPTSGSREATGSISTLLGDGVGFELEMSGIANILSRLIVLGASKSEASELLPTIVDFADIGDAIHRPMKTYSAGMILRVGFGISTARKPDILLVDEVIGAGDITFEQKSQERMNAFLTNATMLVLATHNLGLMEKYCNQILWLEKGEIVMKGQTHEVLQSYRTKYS
jgi:ABC-type polysaccharide/polyol phosphate transport system ATPase subunit